MDKRRSSTDNANSLPPVNTSEQGFTIGYFASDIDDQVMELGWLGVVDAAQALNFNLISYSGESLQVPGFRSQKNIIFDLVDPNLIDGLVVHASAMSPYIGQEGIEDFVCRYQPLPLVSSAGLLADHPRVRKNQRQGVQALISHLIEVHGCRRIIYLRGPKGHLGADERYHGYVGALKSHNLPVDPNLITPPSIGWHREREDIASILRLLLVERGLVPGVDFDAIFADSDDVALQLIALLLDQGIRIPDDVAVVGFNDITESWVGAPALTTVRPLYYRKGYRAAEMLLARLRGENVPGEVDVPCEVVIRLSCGCPDQDVAQAAVAQEQPITGSPQPIRKSQALADWTQQVTASDEIFAKVSHLLDYFIRDLQQDASGDFIRELHHTLNQTRLTHQQVMEWHGVISTLRQSLAVYLRDRESLLRAENLWQQARVLISKIALQAQAHRNLQLERYTDALRVVNSRLTSAFDLAEIEEVLVENLPRLGIPSYYLALYENPGPYAQPGDAPEWARLVLAYDTAASPNVKSEDIGTEGIRFPAKQLLPPDIWPQRRFSFVVEPLYFRQDQIGFMLFEIGPRDGTVYEVLSGRISSSLRGALLFEETRQARAAAEKADQLKTRLLANVSHELRTPLNIIIGSAQQILEASSAQGANLSQTLLDDIQYIQSSAEHQLRLINDLLDLSRAEINELDIYPEFVDVQPLLEETFAGMAETYGDDHTWRLEVPERLPVISADPLRLRQVLLNLLSNANKFAEQGEVVLGAEVRPPNLHIWVQDSGPGISQELRERIFEPFITAGDTRRRPEGAGLGLSITRRIVMLHNGTIKLESEPGQGSTFHVYLPLPSLDIPCPVPPTTAKPVLLLISPRDHLVPEVSEFCQRQALEIQRVEAGDNLDEIMPRVQPAALAWDLIDATPAEWAIVQRLRNHPHLSKIPFIVYGKDPQKKNVSSIGLTSFTPKSTQGETLLEAITGFSPVQDVGPILLVDDDSEYLARNQRLVLEKLPGYQVDTACNGAAAVERMQKNPPCLVILDLVMPDVDGFAVLDWMRTDEKNRCTPVIVLSNKMLTLEDVQRLEKHAFVTLQSKGILLPEEIIVSLHQALFGSDLLPQSTSKLVKRAVAFLHQNYSQPISRWEVAEAVGTSEYYLSRIFNQDLGLSPWIYLKRLRMLHAKALLHETDRSIKVIARQVGINDPAYFSRVFNQETGLPPSVYRKKSRL